MLKRFFWLALAAAAAGWVLWYWAQRRRDELSEHASHFAPPRPFEPAARSIPADDDQVAPVTVPPPAPPRRTPPPAEARPPAAFAPADDDQVAAAQPDPDEALRAAAPAEPPAAAVLPPTVSLAAPEAPPASADVTAEDQPAEEGIAGYDEVIGYCVRCHAKRPIQHAQEELSESGRRAARGTCPVCGANMFTFLAANGDEKEGSEEEAAP